MTVRLDLWPQREWPIWMRPCPACEGKHGRHRYRMAFMDALVLSLAERTPGVEQFVTWNARHSNSPIQPRPNQLALPRAEPEGPKKRCSNRGRICAAMESGHGRGG